MSFLSSLRAAFKGGAGERVPLARTFISPWSWAYEPAGGRAPFEYRGAVREGDSRPFRYYDAARDYQAGLQRADGRARRSRARISRGAMRREGAATDQCRR